MPQIQRWYIHEIFSRVRRIRISKNFGPSEISTPTPISSKKRRKSRNRRFLQKFLAVQKFLRVPNLKNSASELFRSGLGLCISHFLANLMPVKVRGFWSFLGSGRNFRSLPEFFAKNDDFSPDFKQPGFREFLS